MNYYVIIYAVDCDDLNLIRWDWRSWLARQVVALKAVGSNPISHPNKKRTCICKCVFCMMLAIIASAESNIILRTAKNKMSHFLTFSEVR